MSRDARRVLISSGLYTLVVIALLIGGGLYLRSIIAASFDTARDLRETRAVAFDVLRYMLDEETGLRGYAATGNRVFLQPYQEALGPFAATLQKLRQDVDATGLAGAAARVDDLSALNAEYQRTVAAPLLARPGRDLAVQVVGKSLVDRFRVDIAELDSDLTERERAVTTRVQASLDRIGFFVGGAIIVVLLLSLLYAFQQIVLAARLEDERRESAARGRETELMRSAYLAEKRIADTLQDAFILRPLPSHPTLHFSATYVPAGEEARVGGDWYDAIELPEGRVLFAIGDVTGHGIDAAVTMNRVRQALITAALLNDAPGDLLARVAQELHADHLPLVTALVGFADANTYEFVYATAGHPPPVLVEPGRQPRMLPCGSLPLGALAKAAYRNHRVQTVPGATLVLYTDGAIEHSRDVIEGERLLLEAAAAAAGAQTSDPATYIHGQIFAARSPGDDVAILTVGFNANRSLDVGIGADRAPGATGAIAPRPPAPETDPGPSGRLPWRRRRAA